MSEILGKVTGEQNEEKVGGFYDHIRQVWEQRIDEFGGAQQKHDLKILGGMGGAVVAFDGVLLSGAIDWAVAIPTMGCIGAAAYIVNKKRQDEKVDNVRGKQFIDLTFWYGRGLRFSDYVVLKNTPQVLDYRPESKSAARQFLSDEKINDKTGEFITTNEGGASQKLKQIMEIRKVKEELTAAEYQAEAKYKKFEKLNRIELEFEDCPYFNRMVLYVPQGVSWLELNEPVEDVVYWDGMQFVAQAIKLDVVCRDVWDVGGPIGWIPACQPLATDFQVEVAQEAAGMFLTSPVAGKDIGKIENDKHQLALMDKVNSLTYQVEQSRRALKERDEKYGRKVAANYINKFVETGEKPGLGGLTRKKVAVGFIVAAVVFAVVLGVFLAYTSPQAPANCVNGQCGPEIKVNALGPGNIPIQGASVSVGGTYVGATDASGTYLYMAPFNPNGASSISITVSKVGYNSVTVAGPANNGKLYAMPANLTPSSVSQTTTQISTTTSQSVGNFG